MQHKNTDPKTHPLFMKFESIIIFNRDQMPHYIFFQVILYGNFDISFTLSHYSISMLLYCLHIFNFIKIARPRERDGITKGQQLGLGVRQQPHSSVSQRKDSLAAPTLIPLLTPRAHESHLIGTS